MYMYNCKYVTTMYKYRDSVYFYHQRLPGTHDRVTAQVVAALPPSSKASQLRPRTQHRCHAGRQPLTQLHKVRHRLLLLEGGRLTLIEEDQEGIQQCLYAVGALAILRPATLQRRTHVNDVSCISCSAYYQFR